VILRRELIVLIDRIALCVLADPCHRRCHDGCRGAVCGSCIERCHVRSCHGGRKGRPLGTFLRRCRVATGDVHGDELDESRQPIEKKEEQ